MRVYITYTRKSTTAITATRSLDRLLLVLVDKLATYKKNESCGFYELKMISITRSLDGLDAVGASVVRKTASVGETLSHDETIIV